MSQIAKIIVHSEWIRFILAASGVAIILVAGWGLLKANSQAEKDQNSVYSIERINADRSYARDNWPAAANLYLALAERDPLNGLAQFRMADCYLRMLSERLPNRSSPDEPIPEFDEEMKTMYQRAMEGFVAAGQHSILTLRADYFRARLLYLHGDYDEAAELLVSIYDRSPRAGLYLSRDFSLMIDHPLLQTIDERR